jgi:hypothetical protein
LSNIEPATDGEGRWKTPLNFALLLFRHLMNHRMTDGKSLIYILFPSELYGYSIVVEGSYSSIETAAANAQ